MTLTEKKATAFDIIVNKKVDLRWVVLWKNHREYYNGERAKERQLTEEEWGLLIELLKGDKE